MLTAGDNTGEDHVYDTLLNENTIDESIINDGSIIQTILRQLHKAEKQLSDYDIFTQRPLKESIDKLRSLLPRDKDGNIEYPDPGSVDYKGMYDIFTQADLRRRIDRIYRTLGTSHGSKLVEPFSFTYGTDKKDEKTYYSAEELKKPLKLILKELVRDNKALVALKEKLEEKKVVYRKAFKEHDDINSSEVKKADEAVRAININIGKRLNDIRLGNEKRLKLKEAIAIFERKDPDTLREIFGLKDYIENIKVIIDYLTKMEKEDDNHFKYTKELIKFMDDNKIEIDLSKEADYPSKINRLKKLIDEIKETIKIIKVKDPDVGGYERVSYSDTSDFNFKEQYKRFIKLVQDKSVSIAGYFDGDRILFRPTQNIDNFKKGVIYKGTVRGSIRVKALRQINVVTDFNEGILLLLKFKDFFNHIKQAGKDPKNYVFCVNTAKKFNMDKALATATTNPEGVIVDILGFGTGANAKNPDGIPNNQYNDHILSDFKYPVKKEFVVAEKSSDGGTNYGGVNYDEGDIVIVNGSHYFTAWKGDNYYMAGEIQQALHDKLVVEFTFPQKGVDKDSEGNPIDRHPYTKTFDVDYKHIVCKTKDDTILGRRLETDEIQEVFSESSRQSPMDYHNKLITAMVKKKIKYIFKHEVMNDPKIKANRKSLISTHLKSYKMINYLTKQMINIVVVVGSLNKKWGYVSDYKDEHLAKAEIFNNNPEVVQHIINIKKMGDDTSKMIYNMVNIIHDFNNRMTGRIKEFKDEKAYRRDLEKFNKTTFKERMKKHIKPPSIPDHMSFDKKHYFDYSDAYVINNIQNYSWDYKAVLKELHETFRNNLKNFTGKSHVVKEFKEGLKNLYEEPLDEVFYKRFGLAYDYMFHVKNHGNTYFDVVVQNIKDNISENDSKKLLTKQDVVDYIDDKYDHITISVFAFINDFLVKEKFLAEDYFSEMEVIYNDMSNVSIMSDCKKANRLMDNFKKVVTELSDLIKKPNIIDKQSATRLKIDVIIHDLNDKHKKISKKLDQMKKISKKSEDDEELIYDMSLYLKNLDRDKKFLQSLLYKKGVDLSNYQGRIIGIVSRIKRYRNLGGLIAIRLDA